MLWKRRVYIILSRYVKTQKRINYWQRMFLRKPGAHQWVAIWAFVPWRGVLKRSTQTCTSSVMIDQNDMTANAAMLVANMRIHGTKLQRWTSVPWILIHHRQPVNSPVWCCLRYILYSPPQADNRAYAGHWSVYCALDGRLHVQSPCIVARWPVGWKIEVTFQCRVAS